MYCFPMCVLFSCRIAGWKSVSGRSCDRPHRHRIFLVSLCLKANAKMVPKTPSCYCMLLMQPPDLNFLDPYFMLMFMHYNHCHRATAHLQLNMYYYNITRLVIIYCMISVKTQLNMYLCTVCITTCFGLLF